MCLSNTRISDYLLQRRSYFRWDTLRVGSSCNETEVIISISVQCVRLCNDKSYPSKILDRVSSSGYVFLYVRVKAFKSRIERNSLQAKLCNLKKSIRRLLEATYIRFFVICLFLISFFFFHSIIPNVLPTKMVMCLRGDLLSKLEYISNSGIMRMCVCRFIKIRQLLKLQLSTMLMLCFFFFFFETDPFVC